MAIPLVAWPQNEAIDKEIAACEKFEISAPDSAILCYQNTLALSQKNNYKYGMAQSKLLLGLVNSDEGEYATALDFHQNAHDDFQNINQPRGQRP